MARDSFGHRRWMRGWRLGVLVTVVVTALAVALLGAWILTPLGPTSDALTALESSDGAVVTRTDVAWEFASDGGDARVGVVLYPGARIDPRSYAPFAHALAANGYLVAIVPMSMNLAILSPSRADDVIAAHPEITTWAIGGHSLGGSMACRYAAAHPETIRGLFLLASYPPSSVDLSGAEIPVVSVYGTLDGVLSERRFSDAMERLPDDTEFVAIEGGNHAQFGSYGRQQGDGQATISATEQLQQTLGAVGGMLVPLRIRSGANAP